MTKEEMEQCMSCVNHGNCAIEAAGGHTKILNSEEREKLIELYRIGMPVLAKADMIAAGYVENAKGKMVKREKPMTPEEQYLAIYDVANIIVNFAKWIEPIFTEASERVENEYSLKHPLVQKEVLN